MVDLKVANSHILSTSEATPHLTINHDVAADLDSSNAFEGPEKLLEVWFAPSASALPSGTKSNGLMCIPSETWVGMLNLVHCEVLSVVSSEHMDAYLLSESSMFVFPHKLILKTCGTTTLLLGLRRLLRIAAADAGFPFYNVSSLEDENALASPYRVFYSRKNFLFPDKQRGPHRSWSDEIKFLDGLFDNGSAYLVGKMNGDHWYLYITTPTTTLTPPRTPDREKSINSPTRLVKIPTGITPYPQVNTGEDSNDETLEILMTDLDPENAKQFYLSHASAVARERVPAQAREARQAAVDHLGELSEADRSPSIDSLDKSDQTFDVFDNRSGVVDGLQDPMTETELLTTEGHALGTVVSENCGLSDVYPTSKYPDARIDAYIFSPCGFSANAVIRSPVLAPIEEASANGNGNGTTKTSNAVHYFTVHVTPEPNCSFASFETNVPGGQNGRETSEVIEHVVGIFKPGRFIVTLFEARGEKKGAPDPYSLRKSRTDSIGGYRRVDRVVHQFEDYDLVFGFFEKDGWVGDSGARVGEEL